MENGYFELTKSAFHVLNAGYGSSRSEIAELVDDAEFDDKFEAEQIQRAQQSLLAPMARLEQEVSWLPELSEAQISNVLNLITAGDLETLIESSKHFPELAKANILAHLCGAGNVNDSLFHTIIATWDEIEPANILSFVNESRARAGFPGVEIHQMRDALESLEHQHARTAAYGIWTLDLPGQVMDRIVVAELERHPSSSFLEKFVRNYDALSEPELVHVSDRIDGFIELAKDDKASLRAAVSGISDQLTRWDNINQAVQVYEQYQGHEEGRSKRIFEKLRSLCLDLANDRDEFAEARRLSEALLRTFPELESVAEILKRDVAQLETLDEQQKQQEKIEPLIAACETAKNHPLEVNGELTRNGFSQRALGPLADIFSAFTAAVSSMRDASAAFFVVRDLALYINNELNNPQTAFRLLDALLTYEGGRPGQDLIEKLEEDRLVLHRNWKMKELEQNKGNPSAMSRIVDELLKYAPDSERTELLQLKSKLDHMQRKPRGTAQTAASRGLQGGPSSQNGGMEAGKAFKLIGYVLVAGAVGWLLIAGDVLRPNSRTSYQPSTQSLSTPTPAPTTVPTVAQESIPPVGQGLTLNRSQVRYCVFEGERLEAMRPLTNTNYQIGRFNRLIDDFNLRCGNYRYRSGVLSSVEREARENAAEIRADARRIVSSW